MEHIWEVPDENYIKINVFFVSSPQPLPNGNSNGVGVIARANSSAEVWKAMGPMPTMNEEQALMAGFQAAYVEGHKREWKLFQFETTNRDVYDTVRMQPHIVLQPDQLEVYGLFNTIYANHFKEGEMDRCISCVPRRMNSTAEYLANYGMQNMSVFSEVKGSVGELHHFLERDMGRVMPAPINEVVPDIGDGDVVDALPPPPSLKRRRTSSAGMETFMGFSSGSLNHMNVVIDKGKSKLYQEFSFNENGALSQRAIKIMEGHKLDAFAGIFKSPVVDLEAPVMRGIRAQDVLHHAVLGNLGDFLNMANDAALDDFSVLMPLKEVLRALGYNNQGHIKSNPMHGSVHEKGSSSS